MTQHFEKIYVGTRTSPLAMAQTQLVIEALTNKNPHLAGCFECVGILTSGDKNQNKSLSHMGGKALFSKEIHTQLLNEHIHFAVHSLKDLEANTHNGIRLSCVLGGEIPDDVLITQTCHTPHILELPPNAIVGTCSPRRSAQLLKLRPDLTISPLRGNVETRLRKLKDGLFHAIVLAGAGLKRLGLWEPGEENVRSPFSLPAAPIPFSQMLPAIGQGILAVDCCEHKEKIQKLLHSIHDGALYIRVQAERAFLETLQAHCHTAVGCISHVRDHVLYMKACYAQNENEPLRFYEHSGPLATPQIVGKQLGEKFLST